MMTFLRLLIGTENAVQLNAKDIPVALIFCLSGLVLQLKSRPTYDLCNINLSECSSLKFFTNSGVSLRKSLLTKMVLLLSLAAPVLKLFLHNLIVHKGAK